MSNEMSNAPVTPAGSTSVFQTWITALTKPNEQTYAAIATAPGARASTAYLWVFIGYLVQFFVSSLVPNQALRQLMEQYGGNTGQFQFASSVGGRLVTALCGAPITAGIATLFFAIGVLIIQWIAKLFGGRGNSEQLAIAFASILAPFYILSAVFSLLAAIPFVGLCFSLILALGGLYVFILQIMAVKGVNQFGWGPAIGSVILPGLVVGLLCGCLVALGLLALGPAIKDVFQQINQSLIP